MGKVSISTLKSLHFYIRLGKLTSLYQKFGRMAIFFVCLGFQKRGKEKRWEMIVKLQQIGLSDLSISHNPGG
jgi:hypothetical protein